MVLDSKEKRWGYYCWPPFLLLGGPEGQDW